MLSRKNKKRVYRRTIFYYLFFFMLFFVTPIAICSWILSDVIIYENIKADFKPSGLTDYINGLSKDTSNYIYDNSVNYNDDNYRNENASYLATAQSASDTYVSNYVLAAEDESSYRGYDIDSDFTYIGGKTKTIELGNPFSTTIINKNVHFTHTNSEIDYSWSNISSFSVNDNAEDEAGTSSNLSSNSFFQYRVYNSSQSRMEYRYSNRFNKNINFYWGINANYDGTSKTKHGTVTATHYYGDQGASRITVTSAVPYGRLFTVKLVGNLRITKGSTLSIGALIGAISTPFSGGVINGDFACLDLNGHTITIESGATLNAWGYVIDSSLNENGNHLGEIVNNGTIYTSFVVEDYGGGGNTVGRGFTNTMPFSLYSLPYLACKVTTNYGGSIICGTMLYASDTQNRTLLNWIGNTSSYFIQMTTSGDYITIDTYNNCSSNMNTHVKGSSTLQPFHSNYYLNGTININSLTLSLSVSVISATINMSQYPFQIPPYARITISSSSTITLPIHLEFNPGSTLVAYEGSKINFTSTTYTTSATVALITRVLAHGTSYGGISVPTQMPPTGDTSFAITGASGQSNGLYGYTSSYYADYESAEKNLILQNNPRVKINSTLSFSGNGHILSGFMSLGSDTQDSITNAVSQGRLTTFYRNAQTFENFGTNTSAAIDFVNTGANPGNISYGGYTIQPLATSSSQVSINYTDATIDDSGNSDSDALVLYKVVSPSSFNANFDANTYYDFRNGFYYNSKTSKYYIYKLVSGSGTPVTSILRIQTLGNFVEVESINKDHSVTYNSAKYLFFEDTFVPTNISSPSTSGNGLYLYDNSTKTYNLISNLSANYTFEASVRRRRYRGATSITSSSANTTYAASGTASRDYNLWIPGSITYPTSWTNLPNFEEDAYDDARYMGEQEDQGTKTTTGIVYVSNVSLNSFTTSNVNTSSQRVDLTVISQSASYSSSYNLIGTCDISYRNESGYTYSYSDDWKTDSASNGFPDSDWKPPISGFDSVERTRYLDHYYFYRDSYFVSGNYNETGVNLYTNVLSSGGNIKYTSSTGLWTK